MSGSIITDMEQVLLALDSVQNDQTALEYQFDLYKSTFQGKERRKELHDLYHDVFVEVAFGNWVNSATLPLLLHQKVMVYNYITMQTGELLDRQGRAFLFERRRFCVFKDGEKKSMKEMEVSAC